jgi:hypothetical protein
MSPKVDAPPAGTAIKETKFTEVVPTGKMPGSEESRSYDVFEYMDQMKPEDWANVTAYLYRVEPPVWRNGDRKTQVTQFINFFDMIDIQRQYGGGVFRILLRNTKTKERLADSKHSIIGTPRDLTRETQEFSPATQGGVPQENQSIVSKAMDMAANPTAQAAQVDMLRQAAVNAIEMVKSNVPQQPPQLTVKDILELAERMRGPIGNEKPFMETEVGKIVIAAASALVTALVNRLVSPTDPLDQLSKYAEVIGKFSPASSTNDWKAALVQAAPQLAMSIKDTVQELRLGTEAQMRMNAGRTLTAAPPPPPAAPPMQQNPQPQNVVEMPAPQPQTGTQPMEPFETKLVELLNDPQITGDKAGEILDAQWPRIVDEVSKYSADQIMQAFQIRPILQPQAQNPRLRQFLTEFLEWANETDAPPLTPPPVAS